MRGSIRFGIIDYKALRRAWGITRRRNRRRTWWELLGDIY